MPLLDTELITNTLTFDAPWCGSHGADGSHLGMGLVYYALVHALRARIAVCLGSGGGFVPRMMRQAQRDLGISASARTILVDGNRPEAGWGAPAWLPMDSFFRRSFPDIEIVLDTTARAAESVFAAHNLHIDYLHIDADHSFEGALQDFAGYRRFLRVGSVVTLHDTSFEGAGVRHVVEQLRARGDCEVVDFLDIGAGTALVRIVAEADRTRVRPAGRDASLRVERLPGAPALAPAARGWAYLESQAFNTRSMIAASFMRNCETVIELGAGSASIDQFLAGEHRSVIVIDPLQRDQSRATLNGRPCAVEHIRARFQDLRWHLDGSTNHGIVMLGLELQGLDADNWNTLYRLVGSSRATVIEFPSSWSTSCEQFAQILCNTNMRETFRCRIDFSGNEFGDLSHSWPPRCDREIHVLSPS